MIEGDELARIEENSRWEAELGFGVELTVELDTGAELFVIRTALDDVDEEIATWREDRVGQRIDEVDEIVSLPLETGGRQITYDVTLANGFTFEADLLQDAERVDYGEDEEDTETEWAFEGQPGIEMGKQDTEGTGREG
jgi:hypothetical protein